MRIIYFFFFLLLFFSPLLISAQVVPPPSSPSDTLVTVEILPGVRKLEFRKLNDSTQLQILAGNVRLKQGTAYFTCDSCVINNNTNTFEAWGNVHVNDADTANVYSSHLIYLMQKRIAFLDGGVRLTDGKGILTTPDLEYDMNTNLGIYKHGGKVINKKTVLTSQEGYYYADLHDVYFKTNVDLTDPAYHITTDSLLYNTKTEVTRFIAQTRIVDSTGRIIETKEGYYDLSSGKAEFGQRPVVIDGPRRYTANRMATDSTGMVQLEGNAIVIDSTQGTTVIAGKIFHDRKNERTLATNKPLMIIKQDEDSIYITADTLFSARLTDINKGKDSLVKDTIKGKLVLSLETNDSLVKNNNTKDSTNRYLEAYRNVRIFSDSLQAVSDSLFYSFKDSVFRLFQGPVVWSKESQITGDTVYVFTKNKKAELLKVFEKSFLVNKIQSEIFNQVSSTRMDGYFKDGNLDSVRAAGFAKCIYFIQDDDSAFTGINESKSDIIDIYFEKKELEKVVFRSSVTGTIWPIRQKDPKEMKLPSFRWLDERRPKTKFELYE